MAADIEAESSPAFIERVSTAALSVRPSKLLLTLLALPFYVLGWVLGLLYVAMMFAVGAAKVGISDARAKARPARAGAD